MEGENGAHVRTGTLWTAVAQVITSSMGTAALALPWSIAQLGWLLGLFSLLFFSIVTYYTATLLCDCYRSHDHVNGQRNCTYKGAAAAFLGAKKAAICGVLQYALLWGSMIGYTITSATNMAVMKRSHCFHMKGHNAAACKESGVSFFIMFGAIQVIHSQFPSMEKVTLLSVITTATTFAYSFITSYICIAKFASHPPRLRGSLLMHHLHLNNGISTSAEVFNAFQALGNMAFGYACCDVLLELEDTLKSPPPENKTMKKATLYSVGIMAVFYGTLGCMGYLAFGNDAPGNILTQVYQPLWLVDTANVLVIIHFMSSYRVLAEPIYSIHEQWLASKFPNTEFFNKVYALTWPRNNKYKLQFTLKKLLLRPAFVIFTTCVAMMFPFFNAILGLLGAISFWPLTVYFPVSMYMVQTKIVRGSFKWMFMQSLSMVCLVVTLITAVGSVAGIVDRLKHVGVMKIQL